MRTVLCHNEKNNAKYENKRLENDISIPIALIINYDFQNA